MNLDLDKSTWKRIRFGDVIDSITDRVDDPSSAGVDRYVGLEHLDSGVLTVQRWGSPDMVEAQKLRFQPGDVIFGRRRAYQKKVARADFEGICSAHALVLRVKPGLMHPDFLPIFIGSDYFLDRAISISVGSLSPTVNWRDLKVQEFDLPPVDEQERIADLLWTLEKYRVSLSEIRSQLRQTMMTLLAKHFKNIAGRSVSISNLCTTVIGGIWGSPATKNEIDVLALGPRIYTTGEPMISTEGSPVRSISKKQASDRIIREGDIVLERSGGTPTQLVGRVCYAGHGLETCIPTDFQRLLRPNPSIIRPRYLFWLLHNDWQQGVPRAYSTRTTNIGNLNIPDYLSRLVEVPGFDIQDDLLSDIASFEVALEVADVELRELAKLRTTLLNEIFGDN